MFKKQTRCIPLQPGDVVLLTVPHAVQLLLSSGVVQSGVAQRGGKNVENKVAAHPFDTVAWEAAMMMKIELELRHFVPILIRSEQPRSVVDDNRAEASRVQTPLWKEYLRLLNTEKVKLVLDIHSFPFQTNETWYALQYDVKDTTAKCALPKRNVKTSHPTHNAITLEARKRGIPTLLLEFPERQKHIHDQVAACANTLFGPWNDYNDDTNTTIPWM